MISKKEVLKANSISEPVFHGDKLARRLQLQNTCNAMDEYAKEIAIGFAVWLRKNGWEGTYSEWFHNPPEGNYIIRNDEQLFQSYLNTLIQ